MPRELVGIAPDAWPSILSRSHYAAWQCAAMSVGFMPEEGVFQFAMDQAAGYLYDHPQYLAYERRLQAIEAAIGAKQIPDLQPDKPDAVNPVRWVESQDRIPLVPFVSWAIYQEWVLTPEVAALRPAARKRDLEMKYIGVVSNISNIFSNRDRGGKRPPGNGKSLKESAFHHGSWDEYALLLWLRARLLI